MKACRVSFLSYCDLDLWPNFLNMSAHIVSSAYLLYYKRYEFQIWWVGASGKGGVSHFSGHFDFDL